MRRLGKWGRAQGYIEPEGRVRQSQAVGTYGPGAMIDLVHQAVLIGGLDFWGWDKTPGSEHVIQDSRLRDTLATAFEANGRTLSVDRAFFEPPAGNERQPDRNVGIRVLEFPRWFVCQNTACRALTRKDGLELKGGRYRHRCDRKESECVPMRFLGACSRGHCEDWPWIPFVHAARESGTCQGAQLTFEEGATGDFSQIHVRCTTCEARAPLSQAYAGIKFACNGERPWLGPEGKEPCDQSLRLLVRTASNSYFPQIVTALSVPDPSHDLAEKVDSVWDVLVAATPETLAVLRKVPKVTSALGNYPDADVLAAIRLRASGATTKREPLRIPEYRQFVNSKAEEHGELPEPDSLFFARRVEPDAPLPSIIERLVLAPKLREIRTQIGFTRLEPAVSNLQGEFDLAVKSAALGLQTDWLPATELRGEGVFLQLNEVLVTEWEKREAVRARNNELEAGHRAYGATLSSTPEFPGVRFYMLHSLAHMLISAISLECGYAASAIRERIYCSLPGETPWMGGILLMTGGTGTEGTLGGLVEQGRELRAHLRRAYDLGVLCSNDPVCGGHSPKDDAAERWLEGAACHGCLFIAECSCERFNRYLDRSLVVPTLGQPTERALLGTRP